MGRTDEALAYARVSLARTKRCHAPLLQAVELGRVLTARGEDAAALEALEWAATDAQRVGHRGAKANLIRVGPAPVCSATWRFLSSGASLWLFALPQWRFLLAAMKEERYIAARRKHVSSLCFCGEAMYHPCGILRVCILPGGHAALRDPRPGSDGAAGAARLGARGAGAGNGAVWALGSAI